MFEDYENDWFWDANDLMVACDDVNPDTLDDALNGDTDAEQELLD